MSAIDEIAAERRRQTEAEGWTAEHDDAHTDGSIATAAAVYALHPFRWHFVLEDRRSKRRLLSLEDFWPWDIKWLKPKDRRRNLVMAGALIAAEIDRLDRSSAFASKSSGCICQEQHRRGHCTEPGCPYALTSAVSGGVDK